MANNTDWLNISPTSGSSGQTTLTLTASTNTGSTRKTATVKAYNTVCGITSMTYVVLHTLVPIPYTADTTPLPYTGGSRTITIGTSGLIPSSITVSISGATGVTYTYDNGVITVTFPENTGADEKTIDITVEGETQDGDIGKATISYLQKKNYANDYLTFVVYNDGYAQQGTLSFGCYITNFDAEQIIVTSYSKTIEYKINNGSWTSLTVSGTVPSSGYSSYTTTDISVQPGDIIKFRGNNDGYRYTGTTESDAHCSLYISGLNYEVCGNIMSIVSGNSFQNAYNLPSTYTFLDLFSSTISYNTSLISAFDLILPATTMTEHCYDGMFRSCSKLEDVPVLPATTLAKACYAFMFIGCRSIASVPIGLLPVMTLAEGCYSAMFEGCTSLTQAPALPATTLADSCYRSMFDGCTSLTQAPSLPATTLADACYRNMFEDCTRLTAAPVLPATTLTSYCYWYMFANCTSLTQAPSLPATTLDFCCYGSMFSGCTSLTTAPELPATTLEIYSYREMFYGCTSLNYIQCLATDISAYDCTTDWVSGVAPSGTFIKNYEMDDWEIDSVDGIPSGWTVQDAT